MCCQCNNIKKCINSLMRHPHCSLPGFYSPAWWRSWSNSDPHECTTAQLEEAIQGYFTADALPLSISGKPGISGKVSAKPKWVVNLVEL